MDNFIVSARKYRPATFEMVVGQDTITNTLRSAIRNRLLAQAYLFCGPRGVGKTTCARIFAKTINCTSLTESGEACDKCESCLSFNDSRSFNIHELDAASNNKVEDIRSLNEQVRIPPQVGKYSVYIIDEVHMLSSSAFNAFLKTLEEPPPHAIFILATTEKHKIIPTILSRCQIFDFNRIRIEDIVKRLEYVAAKESVTAEEEALHIIAQKADGALRDALSIFDQVVSLCGRNISYHDVIGNLNVLDYEYYFKCVDSALKGDVSSVLLIFNEILENGFDGHNFVAGLNNHLRNLLVSKDEVTLRLLEATPSVKQKYLEQSSLCPVDFLFNALDAGSNCDITYKNSKNQRLHAELWLIKLCRINGSADSNIQKKKPEEGKSDDQVTEFPLPSKSELIRKEENKHHQAPADRANSNPKHNPVIEKKVKSFSVKEVFSENRAPDGTINDTSENPSSAGSSPVNKKTEFSMDAFHASWNDFVESLKGEGTRVMSMFRSIKPEVEEENTIRIHLSNAAQKDLFIMTYKPKLIGFLENRFIIPPVDIETSVDLSESDQLLYTDEQKYNYLLNKYPVLKEFRKSFNLDLP
ncbi:MAG TPA: DNA polymerase III subunit gamma/tau [Bacteroidales bacterium]|nr:DNA polymerase III subunit gamma/tau [Bacteroidales bacterium]